MTTTNHPVLHNLFRQQAAKTPNTVAVVGGGAGDHPYTSLTYAELDALSDSMAARLQSDYNTGIGSLVGIYMPKDVGYVISYLAALKAGGAYMPIDANYPTDLLDMVMEDAKPTCVCTTKELAAKLPKSQRIFIFDDDVTVWRKELSDGRKPKDLPVKDTDPAYCVYSSGTTGKPKGIVCPHRGAVVSYDYRFKEYPYGEDEREACNVFFVWELLRPLLKGATLYVVPDTVIYDSAELPKYIKKNKITRMLFTPSLLEAMLDSPGVADMTGLQLVILCGEVVSTQLRQKIRRNLPNTRIHNLYSVSECHDVTGSDLTQDDPQLEPSNRKFCPVGHLLPQVKANILDPETLEPVPLGVAGEIYVEGPTLAIGYLNRPELTAAKFITRNGKRMYKTGDVGYIVEGGMLEISGRCDSMVKIRGYSIELKAVQVAMYELCGDIIHECIVTTAMHNDDRKLVAYVVRKDPSADPALVKKTIKSKLKSRLPFYMIPTYICVLESLPVNSTSGKLDAKRLPAIDFANEGTDMTVPPATTTERTIASIYARVLDVPVATIDVTLGFFELGGHSLLTIKLLQLLNAEYPDKEITLQDLFDHQSVRRMAEFIVADRAVSDQELDLHQEVSVLQKSLLVRPACMQQVRAFWRNIVNEGAFGNSRVLLTGATGFLGSHILASLLKSSPRISVYCLIRPPVQRASWHEDDVSPHSTASPAAACRRRLLATLEQYHLIGGDGLDLADVKDRAHILVGDVSLESFGMTSEDYDYWATHVDCVVHAAAQVNLLYPYQALFKGNVQASVHVASFCLYNKVKPLHYISTDAVFPIGKGRHFAEDFSVFDADSPVANELKSGYAQTKWAAENLIHKFAESTGLPAVIYRCGNLGGYVGPDGLATWNPRDSNLEFLRACVELGMVPAESSGLNMELTPVNVVSDFIVGCLWDIRHTNGKVFHLIQPHRISMKEVSRCLRSAGYKVEECSLESWPADGTFMNREAVKELCGDTNTYGVENTVSRLEAAEYPEVQLATFQEYIRGLARAQFLPSAPEGPLSGMVLSLVGQPACDDLLHVLQSQGAVVVPAGGFKVLYAPSGCDVAAVVHDVCVKLPAFSKGSSKGAIITTLDDDKIEERGLNAFLSEVSRGLGVPMKGPRTWRSCVMQNGGRGSSSSVADLLGFIVEEYWRYRAGEMGNKNKAYRGLQRVYRLLQKSSDFGTVYWTQREAEWLAVLHWWGCSAHCCDAAAESSATLNTDGSVKENDIDWIDRSSRIQSEALRCYAALMRHADPTSVTTAWLKDTLECPGLLTMCRRGPPSEGVLMVGSSIVILVAALPAAAATLRRGLEGTVGKRRHVTQEGYRKEVFKLMCAARRLLRSKDALDRRTAISGAAEVASLLSMVIQSEKKPPEADVALEARGFARELLQSDLKSIECRQAAARASAALALCVGSDGTYSGSDVFREVIERTPVPEDESVGLVDAAQACLLLGDSSDGLAARYLRDSLGSADKAVRTRALQAAARIDRRVPCLVDALVEYAALGESPVLLVFQTTARHLTGDSLKGIDKLLVAQTERAANLYRATAAEICAQRGAVVPVCVRVIEISEAPEPLMRLAARLLAACLREERFQPVRLSALDELAKCQVVPEAVLDCALRPCESMANPKDKALSKAAVVAGVALRNEKLASGMRERCLRFLLRILERTWEVSGYVTTVAIGQIREAPREGTDWSRVRRVAESALALAVPGVGDDAARTKKEGALQELIMMTVSYELQPHHA
ncbi:hypothetical protein FOL47_001218 [Perkinsus chesapeaki]|uniref:Carrier domain-containing protein n=1 Tax=Perkinsus chesapeaki TaxID=330153 RepID=A0A7J6MJJ1_PERCH|nr:hypothetical protein FOL47_001218 [Perkinsus chesapeaki]